jgi:glycosyltransferase involved in cell wall biosynthesis
MKVYINASNIHVGGGKVLLNDLIGSINSFHGKEYVIFVDGRFQIPTFAGDNIIFKNIPIIQRFIVAYLIEKHTKKDDIVIYLTNLPPIIKHKCKTILVQSNRFIIDNFSLSGFSIKTRIRINVERILFWLNNKNTDYIIVQSDSMYSALKNLGINKDKIKIIAYKDKEIQANRMRQKANYSQSKNIFLYIASGDPHKNHKKLIEAWCLLSKNGIYPKLIITIDVNTKLHQCIMKKVEEYKLDVDIKPNLERNEIINLYSQSTALIFPSLFESYGLPLVEARQYGLPVLASELDYVRDIMDPEETFDPNSPKSINRSVKRFLKINDKKTDIVSPEDFINTIIKL